MTGGDHERRTLRLEIEYDGGGFAGWAAQPGQRTCEGVLTEALVTLTRGPVELSVAGRTDAGVHATGQVASLVTAASVDPTRLLRGLVGVLPEDIAVRAVHEAEDGFDARRDALSRAYVYRVLTSSAPSPLRRQHVLHHPWPLDLALLRRATAAMVGQHDFTAFTPTDTQHVFFDRTVLRSDWIESGDELVFRIEADAFLRHMVRVMVGTLLEVGRGRLSVERFAALLDGARRSDAGPTAPAHPLCLIGVRYPDPRPAAQRPEPVT
ncbi:MAG: tRNA pseudouridine(38-40) synthase TruA [Actinobacteria bacterium]|nr:tRNA pseudouridine(38-40) synthase TruA [Thermoleophilia bacterium]MCB9010459.1 tRNA pseudouridine(38-40) synthase TruA [Actinomycetota bacterium]